MQSIKTMGRRTKICSKNSVSHEGILSWLVLEDLTHNWRAGRGDKDISLLKKFKYWIGCNKTDFIFLITRTTAGCTSGPRVHPEDVRGPESRQWQNYLLPLHMRYRHREYPLRLCCCQGHNPTVKPEGVQPGLTVPRRPSRATFVWLKIYRRDCIICENNLHNTNLLPA